MIGLTLRLLYPRGNALPVPTEYNTEFGLLVGLNTWEEKLLLLPAVEPLLLSLPALRILTRQTTLPEPLHLMLRLRMRTLGSAVPTRGFTASCVDDISAALRL